MTIRNQILERKQAASDYLDTKRDLWDEWEQLFHNQVNDAISKQQSSSVFDPKLSTLSLERSYRVMSQMATGKAKAVSKNDIGAAMLMDLILDKYVNPNANAQFDLLTKFRMIDLYSNMYGNYFSLIDWDIKPNGYIGPDLWLLNIRDVFPQVGAVSIEDSDYIIIRTWKPKSYFEKLRGKKDYKNIDKILTRLDKKSGDKQGREARDISQREDDQYPTPESSSMDGYFEVLTQYEGDRWVDFVTDADMEFRDQKNPHENGELPVVCKYSIPLIDDFMGMGDFERGASMQMVVNSAWNLYLDAVKMSIFPPIVLNKDNISSMPSVQYVPAAKWLARGQVNNVAQALNLSPQGIATFNNTYQIANGSLLNLFGTTDTTVTQQTEAGYGKTPKALQMQQLRENTRDNADRFYMEQFLQKVYKKFVNLISKKQDSAITIRMFDEEIQQLARGYQEIEDLYDPRTGKLTINKGKTGSVLYDYEIVPGSTYALDEKTQQENLKVLIQMFTANPQIGQYITQLLDSQGYIVNVGEMIKRLISKSGIQDWDKIITEKTPQEKQLTQDMQNQQLNIQNIMQQMQMQNMNATPAQPAPQAQPGMPPGGNGMYGG